MRVLMYHMVGPFPQPSLHRTSFCHVRRFQAQMDWLSRGPYKVISLDQAYRGLFGAEPLPSGAVVLTFDDGYENFERWAWPELQRCGFTATVFPVTGRIGKAANWLDESFEPAMLMDGASLRRLSRHGIGIGSHTRSHARLTQLTASQISHELRDSKSELEDLIGLPVSDFCYPYGSYDQTVLELTAEAGYRLALTCLRGAANSARNAYEIPRKAISYDDNFMTYLWRLHAKHAGKPRAFSPLAMHASTRFGES